MITEIKTKLSQPCWPDLEHCYPEPGHAPSCYHRGEWEWRVIPTHYNITDSQNTARQSEERSHTIPDSQNTARQAWVLLGLAITRRNQCSSNGRWRWSLKVFYWDPTLFVRRREYECCARDGDGDMCGSWIRIIYVVMNLTQPSPARSLSSPPWMVPPDQEYQDVRRYQRNFV